MGPCPCREAQFNLLQMEVMLKGGAGCVQQEGGVAQ